MINPVIFMCQLKRMLVVILAMFFMSGCASMKSFCKKPDEKFYPIKKTKPRYPVEQLAEGVEGWVRVRFSISDKGEPYNVVAFDSHPAGFFEDSAVAAVEQYIFHPQIENCQAVGVKDIKFEVRFSIIPEEMLLNSKK